MIATKIEYFGAANLIEFLVLALAKTKNYCKFAAERFNLQ